ncbi:MAG: hypothetical protein LBT00_14710 [Spirochaetaceae bacterium]|nr:hypothetical protein [Spirochaetaceae bacterium]
MRTGCLSLRAKRSNLCPYGEWIMINGEWKMIGRKRLVSRTRHSPFSILHYPFPEGASSGLLHHFVVRNDDYVLRLAMTIVPALST